MHHRIQWRYFAALLIPSVIILALAMGLTLYTHSQGLKAVRQDIEKSSLRVTESISDNLDTLLDQIRVNSSNLSVQIYKGASSSVLPDTLYRSTIDQMTYLQLNAESLLNPIVSRGYVFLLNEKRVISQSSTLNNAEDFCNRYFRFLNMEYAEAKNYLSSNYFSGTLFPDAEIGYMNESYRAWVVAQTIPSNPTESSVGVILYTLNSATIQQRLSDGLADEDSLCLMAADNGSFIASQGSGRVWTQARMEELLGLLRDDAEGSQYIRLADGTEYLITMAKGASFRVIAAQPTQNALAMAYTFNRNIMMLIVGIMMLAMIIAVFLTHRNVSSAQDAMNSIAPKNQPDSATNMFEYMQEAIVSAQENEALLNEHAHQQRTLLRHIFLKRLFRGEFLVESELVREQLNTDVKLESAYYTVVIVRVWAASAANGEAAGVVEEVLCSEFGLEHALVVEMNPEHIACLILSEETDIHDSIEAVAELLSRRLRATCFVGSTVPRVMEVPHSYRQAREMSRTTQESQAHVCWYTELFQDDALYSSEYSLFSETKLSNNIAVGNLQATQEILDTLYEHSMKGSGHSMHRLRFAAYDLYRLVNHIDPSGDGGEDRASFLIKLQAMMDAVLENPQKFDSFFDAIKTYCLTICEKNRSERRSNNDGLLQQALAYIEEHFTDPDMTVGSVAQALNISDKYLSQFFKEQTNEKISGYIERKRIDHACRLLDATELSVNEVAAASGYALTHTFRVAFKKTQGVTPLQWKTSHRDG